MSSLSDPDHMGAIVDEVLQTPITSRIPSSTVSKLLAHPPFISIPGTFNFRDCSLAHTDPVFATLSADTEQECPLAPGRFFRCGHLGSLQAEGIANLKMVGVRMVFDLRTEGERRAVPSPVEKMGEAGIEVKVQADPSDPGAEFKGGLPDAGAMKSEAVGKAEEMMAKAGVGSRLDSPNGRAVALELSILYLLSDIYKQFFKEILAVAALPADNDTPKGLLFHCFAGKDRTGMLSTLLHLLAGSDRQTIVQDFVLSRIGTDVVRDKIIAMLQLRHPHLDFNDPEGMKAKDPDTYVMLGFSDVVWNAVVDTVKAYGGAEWYLGELGFTKEEVETIKGYVVWNDEE